MPWLFSSATKLPEFVLRSNLRIQLRVIDDVVAVLTAGARLQDWRRVTVRDAQL